MNDLICTVPDTVTDAVMWVAAVENIHNGWWMWNMWILGIMRVQGQGRAQWLQILVSWVKYEATKCSCFSKH